MSSRKVFLIQLAIAIILFSAVNLGFSQMRKEEVLFFSGRIARISGDYRWMVVNEVNILIDSNTKVVDEKGKSLKINDLKPELYVRIEGVRHGNGFLAKNILVKKRPEV
jgi:hypothetical protein